MALLKCKMCGGDVELTADKTYGMCEYCGSTMTFPKVDDDQRAAAFNRGNHFRRIGEFDKALAVYERIVREDNTDAEAHWCCALCRFGIEYVEDPATLEYLPTCHRASFDSFLEDVDYLAAVEHSEGITRRQYQKDAAKIAEVQRGILATSQNEEPFDVFICYKESDENGQRTRDSLMAQDVYYQLTDQGYRVFFARITLEDMAGKQYEPYIFAALNSAKVMIVIGTRSEYMNAVWVKNEWSRFLAMMKKDRHKLLLPCYRDMDPYDMPEQLSVLQSYDMGKIGFIQDLTRGIKKVLDADKMPELVKETIVVQQTGSTNIAPLLKRGFMFLEDGDWASANEYCEKVLDLDPECAQAYLGKLMAQLRVRNQEKLKDQQCPFDGDGNYQKAIRFADSKLKDTLTGYIEHINVRNENARLEGIYSRAKNMMTSAATEDSYRQATCLFQQISAYKDAAALAKECSAKAEDARKNAILDEGKMRMVAHQISGYEAAIALFSTIPGWGDADALLDSCHEAVRKLTEEMQIAEKDRIYSAGRSFMTALGAGSAAFEAAAAEFRKIPGWKDADAQATICLQKIEECRVLEEAAELKRQQQAKIRAAEAAAAAKKRKRRAVILGVCSAIIAAALIFIYILMAVIIPNNNYYAACALMEEGAYEEAIDAFGALNGYKDSADKIAQCQTGILERFYQEGISLLSQGRYSEAHDIFLSLGNYSDALEQAKEAQYQLALEYWEARNYAKSNPIFILLGGYKDSAKRIHSHVYTEMVETEPACEKTGVKRFSCKDCDHTYTEDIAATGHDYSNAVVTIQPGCETMGERKVSCHCGANFTEAIAATGHTYDGGKVETPATCTANGIRRFNCKCGKTYTEPIKAAGHSYNAGVVTTRASCESNGVMTFSCSSCKNSYTEEIPATGHAYSEATCTAASVCTNCKHVRQEALGHTDNGKKRCVRCNINLMDPIRFTTENGKVYKQEDLNIINGQYRITYTVKELISQDYHRLYVDGSYWSSDDHFESRKLLTVGEKVVHEFKVAGYLYLQVNGCICDILIEPLD